MQRAPAEYLVDVLDLQPDGLGVAEQDGRPLLVRNALPGETVTARVVAKRRGRRFADAVSVEGSGHPDRIQAACSYFPRCGGCAMQHMEHTAQLRQKSATLRRALAEVGLVPLQWHEPVGLAQLGYRRKARLGVRRVGEQTLVGFRESFSNRVARMESCAVLTPRLSRLVPELKKTIDSLSIADKIPQIEIAQGDAAASILVRHLAPLSAADERQWRSFARRLDVQVLLQSGGYDTLRCVFAGPIELLSYRLDEYGIVMDFHPAQFTQVNATMNNELIRTTLGYLGELRGKRIADLFCGIGNFSLPMARAGACVDGYELGGPAVAGAAHNARRNGLERRCAFHETDLYRAASGITELADAIVLDPPRGGAGPNLAGWLLASECAQVVYISCNPKTFAEDARTLIDQGFTLADAGVFDMFPQTAHVETIGNFRRG